MAKISLLPLRNYPGNSTFSVGDAEISRITTISDDSLLRQDFSLKYGHKLLATTLWVFNPHGSSDPHLKVMDRHWRALKRDLNEVMDHADFYYKIKAKNTEGTLNPLMQDYLAEISPDLFHQKIPDADFDKGKNRPRYYPITSAGQRGIALRNVASHVEGIELDPYELRLMALDQTIEEIGNLYADGMYGKMDEGDGKGLQLIGGGSEGEDRDWRKAQAEDDHPEKDGDGIGEDDPDIHELIRDEDDEDEEPEPWRGEVHKIADDEDFIADDNDDRSTPWFTQERDSGEDRMDRTMEAFEKHMLAFANAANEVWMCAAEHIYRNQPLRRDDYEDHLRQMHTAMTKASDACASLKAIASEEGKNFELTDYLDRVNDKEKGPFGHMQSLIDKAEKPAHLEVMVKNFMNKQRDKGSGPGAPAAQ